jgi:hypothetical protein
MDLRTVKFNGKVYGKKGAYSVYINGVKTDVSDLDVASYNNHLSEIEELKNFKVGNIKVSLDFYAKTKEMQIATLEQLKEAKESLEIEVLFNGEVEEGKFEIIAVKNDVNSKVYVWCDKYSDGVRTYKYENKDKIKAEFNN